MTDHHHREIDRLTRAFNDMRDERDEARKQAAELGAEIRMLQVWADDRWEAEVRNRPTENRHRSTLDGTWRQVQRKLSDVAGRVL